MLIDWFTIGAQALNFLILVWLMKRYLYKPILDAIDAREKLVAAELADAAGKKAEAQKDHDDFQHKNQEFDAQRAALMSKATDEAKAERAKLLAEAQALSKAISRRMQDSVFSITRKALTDLATVSLEERIGEVFTRRVHALNGKAKDCVATALRTSPDPALLRSAFDLPADQRAAIQNALNETFSAEVRLRFETAPDLVAGIELETNGQSVGWSIADYLASMEKSVGELLKSGPRGQ